jgi:hypothetical protein
MTTMARPRPVLLALLILLLVGLQTLTWGMPSGGTFPPEFTLRGGDWYDSWGFNRNYYGGRDGYMPNLAYETLGDDREKAYALGAEFKANYPNKVSRATAILKFVQQWTDYGYDADHVLMNEVPQEEWAWNADELAHMLDETTGVVAVGDCEDLAFLCSTLYVAAGFDVAMVLTDEHVALLIWLPEYPNANAYWDIPDDGKEYGWIWVEATGERNPLGWTPPDFADGDWEAMPLGFNELRVERTPQNPQADEAVVVRAYVVSATASAVNVSLWHSTGGAFTTVAMQRDDTAYAATIPPQPQGQRVQYYVQVTDADGLSIESETAEYVVGQIALSSDVVELVIMGAVILFLVLVALAAFTRRS